MVAQLPLDVNKKGVQVARPIGVATVGTANFQNTSAGNQSNEV
jgi:hypothetical protein